MSIGVTWKMSDPQIIYMYYLNDVHIVFNVRMSIALGVFSAVEKKKNSNLKDD